MQCFESVDDNYHYCFYQRNAFLSSSLTFVISVFCELHRFDFTLCDFIYIQLYGTAIVLPYCDPICTIVSLLG